VSQTILATILATTPYSTSTEEQEIVSWSLEDHEIKLLTKKTQYLDVNRRVSGQPAQSPYEYAVKEITY
jgi:hypothetical protein